MPPNVPTFPLLRHAGGEVAGEEARLCGVEEQRLDVRRHLLQLDFLQVDGVDVEVDDPELHIGVLRRRDGCLVAELQADGDDHVALRVDHAADVLGVVGVGLRLGRRLGDAQVSLGVLQSLEGRLVERLVVEAAGVGDHAGTEVLGTCGRLLAVRPLRFIALGWLVATRGDDEREYAYRCEAPQILRQETPS